MNARLIFERRLELGLSRGDVARISGLSWAMLEALEGRNADPPFLTLSAACRLARVLAVDLNTVAGRTFGTRESDDDVRVEKLLAATRETHTETELAFAMRWTLPRLIDAIERLEHRLTDTGQAIQRCETGIRLTARAEGVNHYLGRLRSLRTTPTKRQAELLRSVLKETNYRRTWDAFDAEQRSDAAKLCELGFVLPSMHLLMPTADASFSLKPEVREVAPRHHIGHAAQTQRAIQQPAA